MCPEFTDAHSGQALHYHFDYPTLDIWDVTNKCKEPALGTRALKSDKEILTHFPGWSLSPATACLSSHCLRAGSQLDQR